MSVVVLEKVSLGFGKKQLVDNLDLRIAPGDRIGLIGPNGSGKSSIMKMVAGRATPDTGAVRQQKNTRVGYLSQDLDDPGDLTVLQTVLGGVPGRPALEEAVTLAEAAMAKAEAAADEQAMMDISADLAEAHERLANFDVHYAEHEAHRILAGLGFEPDEHARPLAELSGGWRMRAVLASLLFARPDVLLLDEPTNHLDLPTVAWFGDFLRQYSGAFVLICHDREFLAEQAGRIVSLEPEGVRQYRGTFEQYIKQRAEEEIVLENQARNLAREREKAEQFIERFRAQANKAKAVQSRIKQLEKMDDVQTFTRRKVMTFSFPSCVRAGDRVLEVEGLAQGFGERRVLDGVNLTVGRGEKIGIIGVNGAGKTTLLRTIAGEIEAKGGSIKLGHNVKLGYYAQHHADILAGGDTVLESVSQRNTGASETAVRNMLGSFLFQEEDVDKPIKVLSGGERARVALARLLIDPGNLVMMDEPTNHLDLESSESLAKSLSTYDGTLIFVSHNRSFVRQLATKIWNVEAGTVELYPGTLDEYIERHRPDAPKGAGPTASSDLGVVDAPKRPAKSPDPKAESVAEAKGSTESRAEKKARKREEARRRTEANKKLGPIKKRITDLEAKIEVLEKEQRARNLALADPETYGDAQKRNVLLTEYQRDEDALSDLNEAWEVATMELEELESALE
ncbi:MAG: ABC-F family ATP-binding cassette domain-containing protein [Myxococcota bacterium]